MDGDATLHKGFSLYMLVFYTLSKCLKFRQECLLFTSNSKVYSFLWWMKETGEELPGAGLVHEW